MEFGMIMKRLYAGGCRCQERPYQIEWISGCYNRRIITKMYCEEHGVREATFWKLEGYKPFIHENLKIKSKMLIELAEEVFGDNYKKDLMSLIAIASYQNILSALEKRSSEIWTPIEVE